MTINSPEAMLASLEQALGPAFTFEQLCEEVARRRGVPLIVESLPQDLPSDITGVCLPFGNCDLVLVGGSSSLIRHVASLHELAHLLFDDLPRAHALAIPCDKVQELLRSREARRLLARGAVSVAPITIEQRAEALATLLLHRLHMEVDGSLVRWVEVCLSWVAPAQALLHWFITAIVPIRTEVMFADRELQQLRQQIEIADARTILWSYMPQPLRPAEEARTLSRYLQQGIVLTSAGPFRHLAPTAQGGHDAAVARAISARLQRRIAPAAGRLIVPRPELWAAPATSGAVPVTSGAAPGVTAAQAGSRSAAARVAMRFCQRKDRRVIWRGQGRSRGRQVHEAAEDP